MNIDTKLVVIEALKNAISRHEKAIEDCGKLIHPEMKIEESAKNYYRFQLIQHKEGICELREMLEANITGTFDQLKAKQ